ncbi:AbrB/MazE/SpoVT family DNA-binding domain-containing protein [Novosphingobium sp. JCM 18896]|uniref:AbrB/MazE/SpoVT family DNA-binding domain-containing protein n=1 Tax=Novosphingobium sp. JCM 18896 TaxID=2989731 RepID=UPI002221EAA6|nr:AbrB/MazE/SpoVT family DNA-binding domain-containing protein [Novosphingobium sp. JCM 18896]MCW1430608.1 AbrB/MazE/SpoVT family DNA-binding domain-containing protein [Novosphingobium sp. JCM 18896]
MTAQTKLSAKGQVVIPKDVRDRLGWLQGSELEVIVTGEGVILRKPRRAGSLSADEALARIHSRRPHEGPAVPVEELSFSQEAYRKWLERGE